MKYKIEVDVEWVPISPTEVKIRRVTLGFLDVTEAALSVDKEDIEDAIIEKYDVENEYIAQVGHERAEALVEAKNMENNQ